MTVCQATDFHDAPLLDELVLISEACAADEFRDRYQFIPH